MLSDYLGREGQDTLLEVCIMFELHNAHAETEKAEDRNGSSTRGSRRGWGLAFDICMVVLMGGFCSGGLHRNFQINLMMRRDTSAMP